jgi:hypothetical protein
MRRKIKDEFTHLSLSCLPKKRELKRRYYGTLSYQLQTEPDGALKAATALKVIVRNRPA